MKCEVCKAEATHRVNVHSCWDSRTGEHYLHHTYHMCAECAQSIVDNHPAETAVESEEIVQ